MKIKAGVSVVGLQPVMMLAMMVADQIILQYAPEGTVLTGAVEGKHSRKSRHYIGFAIDLRSRNVLPKYRKEVARKIGNALGLEWYVAFEKDHFHIQFNGSMKT